MDDILIDRLVIDLPGLSTEEAKELSKKVGEGLAAAKTKPVANSFGTLSVDLNDQATSRNLPRLAEAIVSSLLRQIG